MTVYDSMDYSVPGSSVLPYLPEFTQINIHRVGGCSIVSLSCRPFLLPLNFPSIRVFSNESALCSRWPKNWSFNFSISSSTEYWGLISFTIDWLDLLAVQGTLKGLVQHQNSEASILWRSDFLIVQLSYLYMKTGKTIALTIRTFVSKVMSLLWNTV